MSTIATVALLIVPIIAASTYLLRIQRNQTAILASEAGLYISVAIGYLQLAMNLVPASAPGWMQGLGFLSYGAVVIGLAPITARRITRRLTTAEASQPSEETE